MKSKLLLVLALLAVAAGAQDAPRTKVPLVLISGSGGVSISAVSIGPVGNASASRHDQTFELAEQLLKSCPEVTLTLKEGDPAPDYELFLNHEFGQSQILLVRGADKNIVFSAKKLSVEKAVKYGCKTIIADWKHQHAGPSGGDWWQNNKSGASK